MPQKTSVHTLRELMSKMPQKIEIEEQKKQD